MTTTIRKQVMAQMNLSDVSLVQHFRQAIRGTILTPPFLKCSPTSYIFSQKCHPTYRWGLILNTRCPDVKMTNMERIMSAPSSRSSKIIK